MSTRTVLRHDWLVPVATVLAVLAVLMILSRSAACQSVGFTTQRPFVIGVVPVVGPGGGVGGVSIDALGVVSRSTADETGRLRDARRQALAKVPGNLAKASTLRKVSLPRLQQALIQRRKDNLPPTDEMQLLAGLTRVQYVFVYPEQNDLALAGPAEPWEIGAAGEVVGQTTGSPTLQLDDFLVALRSVQEVVSCSIDPTDAGIARLERLMRTPGLAQNAQTLARMEEAVGPQQIRITGVPADSRFAGVMLGADFRMKRLGMGLEPAPVAGLPSYMEMLQSSSLRPRNMMPRWWLAPDYEPVAKTADDLAWELRGPGVKTLAEETLAAQRDGNKPDVREGLAQQWAEKMTARYTELSKAEPVFARLRNCIDLAVIAALIAKEDLTTLAGCDLSPLKSQDDFPIAGQQVPKTVASASSFVRRGGDWIISISGGVDVDSWAVLERVEVREELAPVHQTAQAPKDSSWWWD